MIYIFAQSVQPFLADTCNSAYYVFLIYILPKINKLRVLILKILQLCFNIFYFIFFKVNCFILTEIFQLQYLLFIIIYLINIFNKII